MRQGDGLRSVSLVIPASRILNYAQSLATGDAAFAGVGPRPPSRPRIRAAEHYWRSRWTSASAGWPWPMQRRSSGRRRGRDGLLGAAYHTARGRARGGHSCSHRPTFGEQLALHRFSVGATPKTGSALGIAGRRHRVERQYDRPLVDRRSAAGKSRQKIRD